MAKQIYIDENGNEQMVSGTINTADMLPIESGSATNTKGYIDSGLSGKANSTVTTGSLSVITGVSITLARSQLVRFGNIAFITFAITTTANITSGTDLLKASSGFSAIVLTDLIGVDNNDNGKPFYISGDKITANRNLTSGASYFVNAWYRLA